MTSQVILDDTLTDRVGVFEDREHAGAVLAILLESLRNTDSVVLGIAAGGVPVAAELACRLELPIDVAVVSKMTLPWSSESGYGAVAFDGSVMLNESLVEGLGLSKTTIGAGIATTREKVESRLRALRTETSYAYLRGATVVLVDDGLASGLTMLAAVGALDRVGAGDVIVAVPTGSESAVERVAQEVSALYCANMRRGRVFAVADAYQRWSDIEEEELARYVTELSKGRPD